MMLTVSMLGFQPRREGSNPSTCSSIHNDAVQWLGFGLQNRKRGSDSLLRLNSNISSSRWIPSTAVRRLLSWFNSRRGDRKDSATEAGRAHNPIPYGKLGSIPSLATAGTQGETGLSYGLGQEFESLLRDLNSRRKICSGGGTVDTVASNPIILEM